MATQSFVFFKRLERFSTTKIYLVHDETLKIYFNKHTNIFLSFEENVIPSTNTITLNLDFSLFIKGYLLYLIEISIYFIFVTPHILR